MAKLATPAQPKAGDVTRLLEAWNGGDEKALAELAPIVYRELRRMAGGYLRRERHDHTLQPTALVHEAYLRLVNQTQINCQTRNHFMAIAANLMRQILVNHANRHRCLKRGGGNKVELNNDERWLPAVQLDMVILDEALRKLAEIDARQCQIVELRFFAGLTEEEIAEVLGVSAITVKRDWRIAKAMLYNELRQRMPGAEPAAAPIEDRP